MTVVLACGIVDSLVILDWGRTRHLVGSDDIETAFEEFPVSCRQYSGWSAIDDGCMRNGIGLDVIDEGVEVGADGYAFKGFPPTAGF